MLELNRIDQVSAVRLHALGQILAFLAMLAVLSAGIYIATYEGASAKIGGSLLGAGSLLGIVRAFLGQKNGKRKKGNNK